MSLEQVNSSVPNAQPGGPGGHSFSDLNPSTCSAWVDQPGVCGCGCVELQGRARGSSSMEVEGGDVTYLGPIRDQLPLSWLQSHVWSYKVDVPGRMV